MSSKVRGFTLVEVLTASVILFASIATITAVYRGAFVASERANNHVKLVTVAKPVLALVRKDIREQGKNIDVLNGQGQMWGVEYAWQANLSDIKAAPTRFDPESENFVQPNARFRLWNVELTLQVQGVEQSHQFEELSWDDV